MGGMSQPDATQISFLTGGNIIMRPIGGLQDNTVAFVAYGIRQDHN
jgi:hypothetical protein